MPDLCQHRGAGPLVGPAGWPSRGRSGWPGALRTELEAESVHSAVAGGPSLIFTSTSSGGTPAGLGWLDVDWPGAPGGDVDGLSARLAPHFTR